MGKNTDKLFITHSEWSQGDHSSSSGKKSSKLLPTQAISSLPFWTCSISQQPIDKDCGVCDSEGHVFDIKNIMPYILRQKINPVTGERLDSSSELTKLKITQNDSGAYIDPVTYKEFQPLSKCAVIKSSGHVYLMSTIKEMCLKNNNLVDLVTETPFVKSDIIELTGGVGVLKKSESLLKQEQQREIEQKELMKKKRKQNEAGISAESSDDAILSSSKKKSLLTTFHKASSVTSTSVGPATSSLVQALPLDRILIPKKFNEPGYAVIETSMGAINVELWAKYSPRAVYNFITHSRNGYYNGTIFHRNIRNFMIQGGDPTGTGIGGESAFPDKKPFKDETNTPYKHDSRGILSMANKGKNTNTSQFFITYRRAPHLDGKHTIFGKVVENLSVLDDMERAPVDAQDRPIKKIIIKEIRILLDPFEEEEKRAREKEQHNKELEVEQIKAKEEEDDSPWLKQSTISESTPIGKYLNDSEKKPQEKSQPLSAPPTNNGKLESVLPPVSDDSSWKQRRKQKVSIKKSSFSGW